MPAGSAGNGTFAAETAAPTWAAFAYLGPTVVGGVLLNGVLLCAVLRHVCRRKGALSLLAHLAVADASSLLLVAPLEVLTLAAKGGAWPGPAPVSQTCCSAFLGMEVLLGAVTTYLLVSLCVHALLARPEDSSSVPAAASWMLAVSLAVPLAWQARTVEPRPGLLLCSLAPPQELAQLLLAVLRVALPALLLLACSLAAAMRLRSYAGDRTPVRGSPLRLALVLALTHCALSLQRPAAAALHALLPPPEGPAAFSAPSLATGPAPQATLVFAMLHHALPAIRPLVSMAACRHVRTAMLPSSWCCRNGRECPIGTPST